MCWKEQPSIFNVYLMNDIFQTSVLVVECKEIRRSQPAIPVLNWVKQQSFPVSIVKDLVFPERLCSDFNGATKWNLIHSSCVIIISLNTDLYNSAFPTYLFKRAIRSKSDLWTFDGFQTKPLLKCWKYYKICYF